MRHHLALISLLTLVVGLIGPRPADAETPGLPTQIVLATCRLENAKTSGTAFVIQRPNPTDKSVSQLLLVSAAHAFENLAGDRATLVLRKQNDQGAWVASPTEIAIRENAQPLWQRHPKYDVAVMRLELSATEVTATLPLSVLATADDWKARQLEPGSLVRCVGFPHAAQFKPSPAAFPLTRLGCVADFPLLPLEKHGTFLVDYNTFEGDSGGPVYIAPWALETPGTLDRLEAPGDSDESGQASEPVGSQAKIIGLVHAQHFIEEKYQLIYQQGSTRRRLGLAIIVNSQIILDTIALVP